MLFFFLVNFLLLCILLGVIQALSFFLYGLEVEHSISIFFRVLFHAYIFLTYTLDQKFTVVTSYLLNRTQKTWSHPVPPHAAGARQLRLAHICHLLITASCILSSFRVLPKHHTGEFFLLEKLCVLTALKNWLHLHSSWMDWAQFHADSFLSLLWRYYCICLVFVSVIRRNATETHAVNLSLLYHTPLSLITLRIHLRGSK